MESSAADWLGNSERGPRRVRQAIVLWFLGAAVFMFFPFRFEYLGPERVTSGLTWLENGGVRLQGPSVLRTTGPPDWLASALAEGELDITVDVHTASTNQGGPARIVTLSDGRLRRNFMISQKGPDLLVRARREGADENGAPPLKVDGVFGAPTDVRVEVRFREQVIEILVNGEPRYREPLGSSSLRLWDPTFRLGLGDEVTGARGWDGELRSATATVRGVRHDLLRSLDLEQPETFWYIPEQTRRLWRLETSHAVLVEGIHVLLFLPFGLLVWWRTRRAGTGALLRIALLGLLVGAFFQLVKVSFPGRHPSLLHAPFNALGTLLGAAWAALRMFPSRRSAS